MTFEGGWRAALLNSARRPCCLRGLTLLVDPLSRGVAISLYIARNPFECQVFFVKCGFRSRCARRWQVGQIRNEFANEISPPLPRCWRSCIWAVFSVISAPQNSHIPCDRNQIWCRIDATAWARDSNKNTALAVKAAVAYLRFLKIRFTAISPLDRRLPSTQTILLIVHPRSVRLRIPLQTSSSHPTSVLI